MYNDDLDVAQAMVWLASDEASFCNGEIMVIDGGYELTASNYPSFYHNFVEPEKNKLRIGAGLLPTAKSMYDKQMMGRDKDDPEGLNMRNI